MAKQAKKIILIMSETQRTDYLGCYGSSVMKTPNLDQLAEAGIRFDNAYTTQPVCGPARSAIFTGQYPHTNGVYANSIPLNQLSRSLGERMNRAGFETAYIGKWHLDGGDYFGFGECPPGWNQDYWYDMRCYLEELSPADRKRSRKPETVYDPDFSEEFTYAHRVSNRAIQYLEKYQAEDLFLVVSYDEPHGPSLCPPEYIAMYEELDLTNLDLPTANYQGEKPEHQTLWAENSQSEVQNNIVDGVKLKQRLGCNSFVDYEIGRVMRAIKQYASDALIIYTADHGESIREHGINSKGAAMYDEITKIPFIISWPEQALAHKNYQYPVSHIDLLPTIMQAAGLEVPAVVSGSSLTKALADINYRVNEQIFMEYHRYEIDHDGFGGFQPIRAVFDGRYKLVINLMESDELYDLEKDQAEVNNLIGEHKYQQIRNNLHNSLLDWMNETRDPLRGYYWEDRPWRNNKREKSWDYTGMTRQRKADFGEKIPLNYATGLEVKEYVRKK
jgi:uncharacterized sulfatase